ncbi:MAG: M50 family metallopeptidase [Clostridia bacterium]|nr:M50 family metallopeptidase [Clostridia bacterium]
MKLLTLRSSGILRLNTPFSVEVHLFLLPLLLSAVYGKYLSYFAISWCSALLHECCHILAGKKMGIVVSGIRFLPFGVCAPLKQPLIRQPGKEILMALSGPFSNLCLAGIFWEWNALNPAPVLSYAVLCNLSLAVLNLLPCLPLDGGRIFRCFLTMGTDAFTACRITVIVSRIVATLLFGTGIVFLLFAPFQFSLLMIGIFLLGNLLGEEKTVTAQMLRELLYYQKKPDESALIKTHILTARETLPARHLLRKLSYHRYLIVEVLDSANTVTKTLTESEILDALFHKSIRITLGKI